MPNASEKLKEQPISNATEKLKEEQSWEKRHSQRGENS